MHVAQLRHIPVVIWLFVNRGTSINNRCHFIKIVIFYIHWLKFFLKRWYMRLLFLLNKFVWMWIIQFSGNDFVILFYLFLDFHIIHTQYYIFLLYTYFVEKCKFSMLSLHKLKLIYILYRNTSENSIPSRMYYMKFWKYINQIAEFLLESYLIHVKPNIVKHRIMVTY